MSNTFVISDHHFGHKNILTFKNNGGTNLRTFSCVDEMDQTMIDNHNKVVGINDKIYFLGDVCFGATRFHQVMSQLKGTKVLIKGNHDGLNLSAYAQHFKDVRSLHVMDKIVLTHVPIHPYSLSRWRGNIHGHLHNNLVQEISDFPSGRNDVRYFNACVEHHDYTPVEFETIRAYYKSVGR